MCELFIDSISAPRKAWCIWSGESSGMISVNHPALPSMDLWWRAGAGREPGFPYAKVAKRPQGNLLGDDIHGVY